MTIEGFFEQQVGVICPACARTVLVNLRGLIDADKLIYEHCNVEFEVPPTTITAAVRLVAKRFSGS